MSKLVIDTNVFISSIIQRSYPYHITTEIFSKNHLELCISEQVFAEYYNVLCREKFAKFTDFATKAQTLLTNIKRKATTYSPQAALNILKDVDDNKFLELAETCKADFLVTGNTKDFTMKEYKQTKIVTPKEFWESYLNP